MTDGRGRDPEDELVERGAEFIEQGLVDDVDDLEVPDRDDEQPEIDLFDEQLRQRVRDRLQERREQRADRDDDQEEPEPRQPARVDWSSLWDEFQFRRLNSIASSVVSRTQLQTAIECSRQDIGRRPEAVIDEAVDDGVLEEIGAVGAKGQPTTRGYRLRGDGS